MRRLQAFLEIAAARGAKQLVLQTGQPLVLGDGQRDESIGDVIGDEELSEGLRAVLTDEQQVDLAVGNVVEFQLEMAGEAWSFVTDPRVDGIVIRGRRLSATPSEGEGPDSEDLLAGIEIPVVHVELPDDDSAPPVSSGSRWGKFEVPVDTAEIDLGGEESSGTSSPQWPSEIGVDLATDPDVAGEAPASGTGEAPEEAGPPALDGGPNHGAPAQGGAPSMAPTLRDVDAQTLPQAGESQPVGGEEGDSGVVSAGPGGGPAMPWEEQLRQHAEFIEPGTLVFLRAKGAGEVVAHALGLPCHVIDGAGGTRAWRAVAAQEEDGFVVVLREPDPSRHLARVLRSLEEGARVVVETRARTLEGARRVLLGVDATERAERWLEVHPQRWFELAEDGWRVG